MITTSRHVHRQSLIQSYTSTGGYIRCRNELHPYIYPWYSSTFPQSDQSYPHPSTFPRHFPNISPTFPQHFPRNRSRNLSPHLSPSPAPWGDLGQRATRTGPDIPEAEAEAQLVMTNSYELPLYLSYLMYHLTNISTLVNIPLVSSSNELPSGYLT